MDKAAQECAAYSLNPVFDSKNEKRASKRLQIGRFEAFEDFTDMRYIKAFSSRSRCFS
jgi:hypothetical protein